MYKDRQNSLYGILERYGYSALALNAGSSLHYLTGLDFHLMERPVIGLFAPGQSPTLILPELEKAKLDKVSYSLRSFTYGEDTSLWQSVFNEALAGLTLSGEKIGVEPRQLRLLEHGYLQAAVDAEFVDGAEVIAGLRSYKQAEELDAMREAVAIAERALNEVLPMVKKGVEERAISGELFLKLIRCGSDTDLPFSPIVASGPNSANPHATPTSRRLSEGDLLLIDWGARYGGYCSDLTRTFAIGSIGEEERNIYQAVLQANQLARQSVKPGVLCSEVDRAARSVIEAAGYGQFFTHRTGHGLGMECHEEPYITSTSEIALNEGNTFTIEPGIYLPGRNGVRIEDDVVVTGDGCDSLSTMDRVLRVLG